ncbi:hypothetical protein L6452_38804 [Arctium lappa]|uniref:Uncharacterized protein n=1 Tax=Arctium lappa TaxID=4217 RepID=A0ACB8XSA0_ARCLA|nr:hypothetical protein L6452_38804 [Arctium lappa]
MDLCGPMRTQSINDKKCVLVIVDDYSQCFMLNDKENLNKFSPKAEDDIFIGYSQTSATYRLYLKKLKTVIESLNVIFDEELGSEQHSSEPVLTGVLASRQISPEPVESTGHNPITSDVSTKFVPPIQQETLFQTPTPSIEDVHENVETKVVDSVGCIVTSTQQPDIVVPIDASAPNTSIEPLPEQEETESGYIDENHDQSTSNPFPH